MCQVKTRNGSLSFDDAVRLYRSVAADGGAPAAVRCWSTHGSGNWILRDAAKRIIARVNGRAVVLSRWTPHPGRRSRERATF